MSGGSWEYIHHPVEDAADRLMAEKCELRRAMGAKLKLFALALHDIEWVDSGDYGEGRELEAIKKALGEAHKADCLEILKKDAEGLISKLENYT